MKSLNTKGFAALEAVLILVIVAILGGTGYYVYQAQNKSTDNLNTANLAVQSPTIRKKTDKHNTPADPTISWNSYNGSGFTFKYPPSWALNACDSDHVLLGADKASAGACQSDGPSQIAIYVNAVGTGNYELTSKAYKNITKESVTISGSSALKESGTYTFKGDGIGPVVGSKITQYVFSKNNHEYYLGYTQAPGMKDVSSDFQILVTKTFKLK